MIEVPADRILHVGGALLAAVGANVVRGIQDVFAVSADDVLQFIGGDALQFLSDVLLVFHFCFLLCFVSFFFIFGSCFAPCACIYALTKEGGSKK